LKEGLKLGLFLRAVALNVNEIRPWPERYAYIGVRPLLPPRADHVLVGGCFFLPGIDPGVLTAALYRALRTL
jgi:hypothetical protein